MITIFHAIRDHARPGQKFLADRGLDERPIMLSATLTIVDYRSSTPRTGYLIRLVVPLGQMLVSHGMVYQQIPRW
jgi:hypothetical protein